MSEPQISLRGAELYLGIRARVTNGIRDFADSAFPELFGWLFQNGVAPARPSCAITRSTGRASRSTYGGETECGFEFPGALERFLVGPADDADFTSWRTEFAYLIR